MNFEDIVRKSQQKLKNALVTELRRMGYQTVTKKGFTYAKGDLPVMLVAHLDTVHREPVKTVCYSTDRKIIMSPEGIGGDDRAGVYIILEIIKQHRCHVLFTEDEEIGGIGAEKFAESGIRPEVNYIVELDRRGSDDAVFYNCHNHDFTEFVCGYGFKEDYGSFSDISIIAPVLGVAAVNISAGYYHEHSLHEFVDMNAVEQNIQRVGRMVSAPSDKFPYIEARRFGRSGFLHGCCYGDVLDMGVLPHQVVPLMQLPDASVIRTSSGDLMESDIQHMSDELGRVYEYLFELDVAVAMEGCAALTEQGLPVKYIWDAADYVDVVSAQYVHELAEDCGEDCIYG